MSTVKPWMVETVNAVSLGSKDPSTKVGAILLYDDIVISTGYNGLKRGADDTKLHDREYKLSHVIHAEVNCILNLHHTVLDVRRKPWMLVTHEPCIVCLKYVHRAGVSDIWYLNPLPDREPWTSMRPELEAFKTQYRIQVNKVTSL